MGTGAATLERVESFVPERSVPIGDLAGHLGLTKGKVNVFTKMYGLANVRFDPDMGLFDLVLPAPRRVVEQMADPGDIRLVVFAHTTQVLAPADIEPARVIRDELGLYGAEAFTISQQNCASGMAAVDVAAALLHAEHGGRGKALVVTGEQAFSPLVQLRPGTTVMGDAAAACLVGVDGPDAGGDVVRAYRTTTYGEYSAAMLLAGEKAKEFGEVYPKLLAEVMTETLAQAGLSFDDIDLVIPHNVNLFSWRQAIDALGIPRDQVFLDNVPRFSHCYASDVFVNYTTLRDQGRLVPGRAYLLASVGLGATFAAMAITHREA